MYFRFTLLLSILFSIASLHAETHPRIYADRLDEIRKAIKVPDSHHAKAFAEMKKVVDASDLGALYGDHVASYQLCYRARELAFLCLLSEDAAEKKKYANMVYDILKDDYGGAERKAFSGYGLSRAMMSIGLGLCYDWCYEQWNDDQRSHIKAQVNKALDAWPKYSHANIGGHRGSNWAAVCYGGQLVLMIGGGEETNRADRYKKLKGYLKQHMKTAYGDLGYSQEGTGYTEYGGSFLWRAIMTAKSVGDDELYQAAQSHKWWNWFMYSHAFKERDRKFLQGGVSHGSNYNEGAASFMLGLAPEDKLPYVTYWYDHHMGKDNPLMKFPFDGHRAARVDALYCYPTKVEAKDPTPDFPKTAGDKHGYYFFRNRWKDANDILISMHADTHHHSHAWDKPEVGALNILAFNTRFIGGPGKDGGSKKNPSHEAFSAFLIDGKYFLNKKKSPRTGKKVAYEPSDHGGYVIVDGGPQFKALGATSYQRHGIVDFSLGEKAIISTLDKVEIDGDRSYSWNANIGSDRDDDEVKTTTGTDAGLPSFMLTGRNNGSVKGWLVHPKDGKIVGDGKPLRFNSKEKTMWVVLWVGQGDAPTAKLSGEGLDATLTVDGKTISYDSGADRIQVK